MLARMATLPLCDRFAFAGCDAGDGVSTPTMQLDDRRSDELCLESGRIVIGRARRTTPQMAIRAGDRVAEPSSLPAPIQKQANRGFEPPVF